MGKKKKKETENLLSFLISEISRAKNHTLHAHMSIRTTITTLENEGELSL